MSTYYPYHYKGYPEGLKYPWTIPGPSNEERDRRWKAIRESMKRHNLDCIIIGGAWGYMSMTKMTYIHYVSNYQPYVNSGTFIVFPRDGEPQLGVHNMNGPQFLHCAIETSWMKEVVGSLDAAQDIIGKISQLKLEEGTIGITEFDIGVFPASVYEVLRKSLPGVTFIDATSAIGEAMDEVSRESEEELELLKKACEILDHSYETVAATLRPGIKECELWAAAEYAIINNGGWYPHFMLVASGPNPTFLRAPASLHTLSSGDVAMFEINVTYGGIFSQISYTLSIGQPNNEVMKMFEFCKELYEFSLVALEKNKTFMEVELDMVRQIHAQGYELMTPQIHGCAMSGQMDAPPRPGDYFTLHPSICNEDYTAGAKFGDTIRMNNSGKLERLQRTPAKLNIIEEN